ncbi:hypothetical protein Ancab_020349 [Ancistrocladus abbreviatus]
MLLVTAIKFIPHFLLKFLEQMVWKMWQNKGIKLFNFATLIQPLYIITTTTLSLLLPLSFLLLARLSGASYLLSMTPHPQTSSTSSLFFSVFLHTNPTPLLVLLAIVTLSALIHGLTGRISLVSEYPGPSFQPTLLSAWILLCTLQLCVGLGIEASIAAGVNGSAFADLYKRSLVSRVIFFIGLHETMLHWSRTVVRPVVDDAVFGGGREERWVEKAALAASFGGLWWWKLRQETDALVTVVEAKVEMGLGVWVADYAGWWLYYVAVTIGMARLVKGALWLSMFMFCRNLEESIGGQVYSDEDKV